MGPRRLGQLVDHGTMDPNPSGPGEFVDITGHRAGARVTWERSSIPWALGPGPELPGTAGRLRRPSDLGPSHKGQLVDTARPRARARVAWDCLTTP